MEKTNTASTASTRAKAPKKRNSDARKEQNRIASRAYREKRKQKLALLDEILKSDSQTDSMSSVSDDTEGYTGPWPFPQSRHASNSPIPTTLSTPPAATSWPTTSQPMSSDVQGYGHNIYDGWMSCFDRPDNALPTSNDYVHQLITTEIPDHPSPPYGMQPMPSITSTPPTPPLPLDPMLVANHVVPHHHSHPVPNQSLSGPPGLPVYGDDEIQRQLWVSSLKDDALMALERFAEYSHVQQRQVLSLIQKRRSLPQNATDDQGMEFRYLACQGTPPTQFASTDYRKYQSPRHDSR
ncbi:hypothetical protein GGS23DRAFT_110623 [Durotheca rogersii]|uniref:uncharacterized protein n=1 Tax=Durotheca rogersii TaxID=419775 RepID=UPI00221F4FD7|nr:uncharacterized protein GGS23DRAFT_110623 [Durotheca rogersii]KAI5862189.1 hypothetical protein GGS23DRAFT_110623 [Durotheca rogersii]